MIKQFLLTTFIIVCVAWGSCIVLTGTGLLEFGNPVVMILYLIGGLSPTIAPFIVYRKEKLPRKDLLKSMIHVKVSFKWYLYIIVVTIVNTTISVLFSANPVFELSSILNVLIALPVMIIGGGLEEVGWRGVLQKNLPSNMNIFVKVSLIAAIWFVWHIPLFFIIGTNQNLNWELWQFFLFIIPMAIYLTIYMRKLKVFLWSY